MDLSIRELLKAGAHCTNAPLHFLFFIYRDTSIFIGFWEENYIHTHYFNFKALLTYMYVYFCSYYRNLTLKNIAIFSQEFHLWLGYAPLRGMECGCGTKIYVFDPLVNVEDWIGKRKERRNLLKNDPSDKKASILNLLINTLRSIPDCYIF